MSDEEKGYWQNERIKALEQNIEHMKHLERSAHQVRMAIQAMEKRNHEQLLFALRESTSLLSSEERNREDISIQCIVNAELTKEQKALMCDTGACGLCSKCFRRSVLKYRRTRRAVILVRRHTRKTLPSTVRE